jgi:hypothetical protein
MALPIIRPFRMTMAWVFLAPQSIPAVIIYATPRIEMMVFLNGDK